MRMKEPDPQPPRPVEGRGASVRLITGFPQDRRTWPIQIAAFKVERRRGSTGLSKEKPVTDSDLMKQFAESLSRLLEGSLGEPNQGDPALPEGSPSALQSSIYVKKL
jgi:hypothetical protein